MTATPRIEWVLHAGRSWPSGHERLAIAGGRIVACGDGVRGCDASGAAVCDVLGGIIVPGLVDLHAHPCRRGSVFGVDPDAELLPGGVTAALSQGDAGADGLEAFLADTIRQCRTEVKLAINLSRFGESRAGGAFQSLDDADVALCVGAVRRGGGQVWGISVNCSHQSCPGADPREVLRRAILAAEETGRPLLVGLRRPEDWPLAEQLRLLRPGDVVTYCYRLQPHCLVENRKVRPEFREARGRGVLFDVGHGRSSFSFAVAEAALADGFPPDTISTDFQAGHVGGTPPHSLPRVVSKLIAAGMDEEAALSAATTVPARILGIDRSLTPGREANLAILAPGAVEDLVDCHGEHRRGRLWQARLTVQGINVCGQEKQG